ncbi:MULTISPECIES: NUDIX hydrolase [unclassified Pseudomonas]|jgi:ADP-ribose pyrophosphatase YjhB (NUDIX family)|uniref:NUDIX hydrolase n=1 Tax=unclassified Pseudomonas TaxID=196821 RepID=UPI000C86BE33|nr:MULTISPECIES: NUDIX hydrolase [unclassified Pseudomonas]PMV22373.1 NUDIX hydrolase [Pseudomonas sp. FW305-3-2-15-C-TSA2]PMV23550.1 NUDIX hydrolase [Pseudomonas sp. DP16D-L5]PMV35903.1 NUDIX hydrolase [Pseudomonas sp. FW305-3-2-15-A-LB2]PMV39765.1 NUDIX hydrolase [Pseudomonas sp. FW305-3-2-15-C-R2A1]PMV47303.1 NUDIX hydrolase [Pseudomonas sp. FW305-3-2-15-C-LB1]
MPRSAYLHTVDLCVLSYCRISGELKLLLNQRDAEPFAGHWALPGVVVNGGVQDLSLQAAVERLRASDKVGLDLAWSEQVGTVGDAFRDPRCWSSSTYYLAIVNEDVTLGEHQGWYSLTAVASGGIKLPFDHNSIVAAVQDRLFSKSLYSNLPLMFLGNEFSAPDATTIFSLVLARPVLKTSIRQRLLKLTEAGYLRETGRKKQGEGGRPQATVENLKPGEIYFFDRSFAD